MDNLTLERKNTLNHATEIVDAAKSANRELTSREQSSVEADLERVGVLDQQIKGRQLFKSVMSLTSADAPEVRANLFTEEAKAGILHAVKTRTTYRTDVDTKAAITTGSLLPTSGSYVEGGLHPNAQFPLASLFMNKPAEGPVQRYYRMTAGTAEVVAEGALKPDAGVAITGIDLALAKLACTAQYSTEMAEDAPYLVGWLSTELGAAVAAAENARILDTFGTTSGVLTGTGTTATVIDLLADAIAGQEGVHGRTPTAVIAHPTVVATIRKGKASTGGDYFIDPLTSGPTMLHGVRVIPSPATPAGTAWVVDAAGVLIYRRGSLSIEVGTNADDFTHNLRTAVAEERMAAAVVRPTSLTKLTLT